MAKTDDRESNAANEAIAMTKVQNANSLQKCYLLELPRELRHMIIELIFVGDEDDPERFYMDRENFKDFRQPWLAFTHRQLRTETLAAYCSSEFITIRNIWSDDVWYNMKQQLCSMQQHVHTIKELRVNLCEEHDFVINIEGSRGSKSRCRVTTWYFVDDRDLDMYECWDVYDKVKEELQPICDRVGSKGFTTADYIQAVDLFLYPEDKRCLGDSYIVREDLEIELSLEDLFREDGRITM